MSKGEIRMKKLTSDIIKIIGKYDYILNLDRNIGVELIEIPIVDIVISKFKVIIKFI